MAQLLCCFDESFIHTLLRHFNNASIEVLEWFIVVYWHGGMSGAKKVVCSCCKFWGSNLCADVLKEKEKFLLVQLVKSSLTNS